MRLLRLLFQYRLILTILLAFAGIGVMAFYAVCDTACSYLRGDIFGIDLKYIGVGYMGAIIALAVLKQADLMRMLVAAGVGVEVFLVSFQVSENVFCPFCLSFGMMVLLMYLINYERCGIMNNGYQKLIYAFGDAKIPFTERQRFPLLAMMILGYLFVSFTFSGSATPAYAADHTAVPSYGRGAWELIIFTDYFCPPCQSAEKYLEPELERLLARGGIKITFVDYPGHGNKSALFAKYFLCAAAADKNYANAMKARNILFSLAPQKNFEQENVLAASLKAQKVALKMIDPKPVYTEWLAMIKRYEINATPTCLLRYSSTYTKKYGNADEIRTGLIPELQKRFPEKK